jgi:hypothetical protein
MNIPPDSVRVSAAALCWIPIDNGCLMEINPNHGNVIAPLGGALRYSECAVNTLAGMGAIEEKPGARELRLYVPRQRLEEFCIWFASRLDREITPLRELTEELVEEHEVLPSLCQSDTQEMSLQTTVQFRGASSRSSCIGTESLFLHEIFLVRFVPNLSERIAEAAASHGSRIKVVAPAELDQKTSRIMRLPISESAVRMWKAISKHTGQVI